MSICKSRSCKLIATNVWNSCRGKATSIRISECLMEQYIYIHQLLVLKAHYITLPLLIRRINHSWNHLSSPGSIQLNCCHFDAYRANQTQQPTPPSQVPIYSWVERSNYGQVSCSRTWTPRSRSEKNSQCNTFVVFLFQPFLHARW